MIQIALESCSESLDIKVTATCPEHAACINMRQLSD